MIKASDRVLFAGKTGSGKTWLARRLLATRRNLIIIDPGDQLAAWSPPLRWPDRIRQALQRGKWGGRIRLVPPLEDSRSWYDSVFGDLFARGDCLIYIDELYALAPQGSPPPVMLQALYTRGRSRGIGVWACTQRPRWVPLYTISESEHIFCFKLHLIEDRQRLAAFAGDQLLEVPPDPHGFWYYNTDLADPVYVADGSTLTAGSDPAKMNSSMNDRSERSK